MDMMILGILGVLGVVLVCYSVMPKKNDQRDAVKRRLAGGRGTDEIAEITKQARASATEEFVSKATPMLTRLIMPTSDEERTNLRAKLASAGFRHPQGQTLFLASQTMLGSIGLALGLFAGFSLDQDLAKLGGISALSAAIGFLLPKGWLALAIKGRKEKLRYALPDTLDLLVVSVESGLALDAALKRVGDEMMPVHPELSEELRIATMESQMGIPRAEALQNMADRTALAELRSLVSMIIQAEKFGTSVASALRNQAESLRVKRHQQAEERAQKTAVKLMIPLVLFIFPAMGVVLAGPAALKMLEALKNNPTLN
ncbi:MAG: type II secretion system F family protein [Planctomycetes bacterium]|nr:type II secretion system F family protein [Planctomycetota bacterium]